MLPLECTRRTACRRAGRPLSGELLVADRLYLVPSGKSTFSQKLPLCWTWKTIFHGASKQRL